MCIVVTTLTLVVATEAFSLYFYLYLAPCCHVLSFHTTTSWLLWLHLITSSHYQNTHHFLVAMVTLITSGHYQNTHHCFTHFFRVCVCVCVCWGGGGGGVWREGLWERNEGKETDTSSLFSQFCHSFASMEKAVVLSSAS